MLLSPSTLVSLDLLKYMQVLLKVMQVKKKKKKGLANWCSISFLWFPSQENMYTLRISIENQDYALQ